MKSLGVQGHFCCSEIAKRVEVYYERLLKLVNYL
jgi:hypothetical protein